MRWKWRDRDATTTGVGSREPSAEAAGVCRSKSGRGVHPSRVMAERTHSLQTADSQSGQAAGLSRVLVATEYSHLSDNILALESCLPLGSKLASRSAAPALIYTNDAATLGQELSRDVSKSVALEDMSVAKSLDPQPVQQIGQHLGLGLSL